MNIKFALSLLIGSTLFSSPAVRAQTDAPRRVLLCTLTAGFRHGSIPQLREMFLELAEQDGRFEIAAEIVQPDITIPRPPQRPREPAADAPPAARARFERLLARYEEERAAWTPEHQAERERLQAEFNAAAREAMMTLTPEALRENKIDLVVFANASGNLPVPDMEGFIGWIHEGGAFVGIHAATDALKYNRPYTEMIQGVFDGHGPPVPVVMHAGDADHPANGGMGAHWELTIEEMYLFRQHDVNQVRTLWYLPHHPNHPDQAGHFPVAWCRQLDDGRMFYTSLGHMADLMSLDPDFPGRRNSVEMARQYRAHVLGGVLWTLGLEDGSGEPNADRL